MIATLFRVFLKTMHHLLALIRVFLVTLCHHFKALSRLVETPFGQPDLGLWEIMPCSIWKEPPPTCGILLWTCEEIKQAFDFLTPPSTPFSLVPTSASFTCPFPPKNNRVTEWTFVFATVFIARCKKNKRKHSNKRKWQTTKTTKDWKEGWRKSLDSTDARPNTRIS